MNTRWDLAVYNHDEQLVLVVEIKNILSAGPVWAGQLRRNILAHGVYPNAPYFLMAFRDQFYLWTQSNKNINQTMPDYVIDARPILQPYLAQAGVALDQISGQSLELVIVSWLGEMINANTTPDQLAESERWLVDSGLLSAIAGGRFEHEVAA
jgi:hypothetical protein